MSSYLAVAFGGALGSMARYFAAGSVYERLGTGFPYGTLAVNVAGCFLIGLIMELTESRFTINPQFKIFLTIGVLGGFTTFSTFSFETLALARDGLMLKAGANAFGSLFTCLMATWVGMVAGRIV
ncbi:MAG: fluoride efflux transporter CrcB [Nitrospinae bacterium]|nr:fluoride efflux transporter CrcB [Nitrospinota bacterium]